MGHSEQVLVGRRWKLGVICCLAFMAEVGQGLALVVPQNCTTAWILWILCTACKHKSWQHFAGTKNRNDLGCGVLYISGGSLYQGGGGKAVVFLGEDCLPMESYSLPFGWKLQLMFKYLV